MKNKKFLFDDIKSVSEGILSTISGLKAEIENIVNSKISNILNSRGYVTREDFHALEDRVNKIAIDLKKKNKKKM